MSNIINSNAYVKQGDKVYKVNGGAPIHTFNSVEEMNAANLADGSIALVPSAGGVGGGLPVVEITSDLSAAIEGLTVQLTESESEALGAAFATGLCPIIKFNVGVDQSCVFIRTGEVSDSPTFSFSMSGVSIVFAGVNNIWSANITPE